MFKKSACYNKNHFARLQNLTLERNQFRELREGNRYRCYQTEDKNHMFIVQGATSSYAGADPRGEYIEAGPEQFRSLSIHGHRLVRMLKVDSQLLQTLLFTGAVSKPRAIACLCPIRQTV